MILDFKLPLVSPHMAEAVIESIWAKQGASLKSGDKLLDLSVHLGVNFDQDCPPIAYFRVIVREKIVLREFRVALGKTCQIGEVIAVFSSTPDEAIDLPAERGIRFATAGIIHHEAMWTGNVR